MDSIDNKLIAIVRIRGRVGVMNKIVETLERLRLKRVNNCVVVKATKSYVGMIKRCSNYIAYGEIDELTLKNLFDKNKIELEPKKIMEVGISKELRDTLPIKLHPPRHGYKSIKRGVNQGGSLGYRGPQINELIKRMI